MTQRLEAIEAPSITLYNTGLHLLDTNASHDLIIAPGSDLTADRTLTLVTGDADRTLTLANSGTAVVGTGTATRLAEWSDANTIAASTLIKTGAGVLTLDAAGAYTLTVPATGTAALLATANVFTAIQKIDANSAAALLVEQDGVNDNVLVVDTANARVGVNVVPSHPLEVSTGQGNVWIRDFSTITASTDAGIALNGKNASLVTALCTEVDGEIMTFAVNVPQIQARNNAVVGGIVRLDTRVGFEYQGAQGFYLIGFPTGGATPYFRLIVSMETGNTYLCQSSGTVAVGTTTIGTAKLAVDQSSTTGALPVLLLDQGDVSEEFIRLIGTSAADNTQSFIDAADLTTPGTLTGWIKVYIQDDASSGAITDGYYYVPFYTAPTA